MASVHDLLADAPGDFRVGRDIYRDPQVFDWEMRHVFEGTWNFLGLASQLPRPFDYFTTHIGRAPVLVSRDAGGQLHAVINSCRHKGALVAHRQRGNARNHVCQYHGWAYDAGGRNVLVKDKADGAYGAAFDAQSHDLQPIARFGEYRGLLFGSLSEHVPPLDEWLGDVRRMLDLIVDQSPDGVECIPGTVNFTFRGNWKLQMENGVDPYHFASTHPSYIQALQKRAEKASVYSGFRSRDLERGTFAFANGHNTMWGPTPPGADTPLAKIRDEIVARVGEVPAKWMGYVRNTTLFPNAQFAENASLQLRIWRPLAPDRTEMRTFLLAPVGEPAEARAQRIRQYEEFFNPTGLATPDDIANYEDCQRGLRASVLQWQQGAARGEGARAGSVDHPSLRELGVQPQSTVVGSFNLGDETVMQSTYRQWAQLIERGLARERAEASHG
jgi:phenylpropionate dioxygenase-like ring-hydroxylating dioxygenase large terminal subunit